MSFLKGITVLLLLVFVVMFHANAVLAHWDMEPRFLADDSKEKFFLTIHNGYHANRKPVKKNLNVCFWIEKLQDREYKIISEKRCTMTIVRPDEWVSLTFDIKDISIQEGFRNSGRLKRGSYRAVTLAREQKSRLAKILFGAALERLYAYFEIK
ncbi:MAG: hypothetical protein HZA09_03915 [Nitrospirae bacterium]|nr:hypothetical protein [Nitrospirota bacterium]